MNKYLSKILILVLTVSMFVMLTMTFTACEKNRSFVTLMVDGEVHETLVADTEGVVDLPTYSKDGYMFSGWYFDEECKNEVKDGHKFFSNTVLYCGWISLNYTVTFDPNGGTFADEYLNDRYYDDLSNTYKVTVQSGKLISVIPELTKEHYVFDGWMCDNETVVLSQPFDKAANVTYTAVWIANKSRVCYDPDGGAVVSPGGTLNEQDTMVYNTVEYNSVFKNNYFAVKEGYNFKGWKTENDKFVTEDENYVDSDGRWKIEKAVTLTAYYEPRKYVVSIGSNEIQVEYGSEYDFTQYEEKKSGYVFSHWEYSSGDQSGIIPSSVGIWNIALKDKSVELTPVYMPNKYSISYYLSEEDTQPYAIQSIDYGDIIMLPEEPVAPAGIVFVGWYDEYGDRLLEGLNWYLTKSAKYYACFETESNTTSFTIEFYLENADYSDEENQYTKKYAYVAKGKIGDVIEIDISLFQNRYEYFTFDEQKNKETTLTLLQDSSKNILAYYFNRKTVTYTYANEQVFRTETYRYGQTVNFAVPDGITRVGHYVSEWAYGDKTIAVDDNTYKVGIATDADNALPFENLVFYAVWEVKTYDVYLDGEKAFSVKYGEIIDSKVKDMLILNDTADRRFNGWDNSGNLISLQEINELTAWLYDSSLFNAENGTYEIYLISSWTALTLEYKIEVYLDGELSLDYTDLLSKTEDGEYRRAEIGSDIYFNAYTYDIDGYEFDRGNENNLLILKVEAGDEMPTLKVYYKSVTKE